MRALDWKKSFSWVLSSTQVRYDWDTSSSTYYNSYYFGSEPALSLPNSRIILLSNPNHRMLKGLRAGSSSCGAKSNTGLLLFELEGWASQLKHHLLAIINSRRSPKGQSYLATSLSGSKGPLRRLMGGKSVSTTLGFRFRHRDVTGNRG